MNAETSFYAVTFSSAKSDNDHFVLEASSPTDAMGQVAAYLLHRGIGLPNPARLVKRAVKATRVHRTNYNWLPIGCDLDHSKDMVYIGTYKFKTLREAATFYAHAKASKDQRFPSLEEFLQT